MRHDRYALEAHAKRVECRKFVVVEAGVVMRGIGFEMLALKTL